MQTVLTTSPHEAAAFLRRGQPVAFPTETVYGLGADAFDAEAVRQIFAAKGRPSDNPLIVHVARLEDVERLARTVPEAARVLIDRFFPGPLTLILPRAEAVPPIVTAGLDTVGIRMPRHPLAQRFLVACATPVAAPSANRSGRPSPTTWQAVHADLDGRIACILKGPRTDAGLESTVVDCTGQAPVVLRAGALPLETLQTAVPATQMAGADDTAEAPRSPGTRHRHYAPDARVVLVARPEEAEPDPGHAYIGLDAPGEGQHFEHAMVCSDTAHYARELFHFFRTSDAAGCTRIYCQTVAPEGLGRALMDRLQRAAAGSAAQDTSRPSG